jgi:hypothetical protein
MRPPVPISTLSDAAKWMSELSGATMTEREVLGHAFNFQWTAERPRGEGDEPAAPGMTVAAREAERIVQVIIHRDVEMRLRQWRLDGYTDRPVTQAERIIAIDSHELFDLLTYDYTELTLPRPTGPYEGDEHAEFILSGTVLNQGQVRIYARGLYALAAWWQLTVGAVGTPGGQRKYVPKQKEQEQAILDWLRGNEYDPTRLPEWKHDVPGAKAGARAAMLANRALFGSDKVFELAWTRLRNAEDIGDAK